MALTFHRLVQADLRTVLRYYEEHGGVALADRFFAELEVLLAQVEAEPRKFHPVAGGLRRANLRSFPYHVLFEDSAAGVRVLVLRHHRRHPRVGRTRQ